MVLSEWVSVTSMRMKFVPTVYNNCEGVPPRKIMALMYPSNVDARRTLSTTQNVRPIPSLK